MENNLNQKKDIYWINALKALCMIFVFFVHCQLYYGTILKFNNLIYPFYVNGFFFISGYLLFRKQLSTNCCSKNQKELLISIMYKIVVPSIIFSIITFLPSCFIQGRNIDIQFFIHKTMGGGTYWFTSSLVVAELVVLLLLCTSIRNIWFYVISSILLCTFSMIIVQLDIIDSNIWCWKQGLIALFFLSAGGLYWKYEKYCNFKFISFVTMLAIYVLTIICLKEYNNALISTLQIEPIGFITSILSCMLLVFICKKAPNFKILTFIGQNSLGFYFLSGALPITLSAIVKKIINLLNIEFTTTINHVILLLIFIICIILAYLVVSIMNKYFPWLFDLRLLKRKK